MSTTPDALKQKLDGLCRSNLGDASGANDLRNAQCRRKFQRYGMKWGNESIARSAIPRRAGWPESFPDGLQAIRWEAGWPLSPLNAVDGDRPPKCWKWTSFSATRSSEAIWESCCRRRYVRNILPGRRSTPWDPS